MLAKHRMATSIPTADFDRARRFYEQTLGFSVERESPEMGVVVYSNANGAIFLYTSEYAGTNKATVLSFEVPTDAFDEEIRALRAAGVTFDTFDLPDATWEDGVARMGEMSSAWFRDPDGNILAVGSGDL